MGNTYLMHYAKGGESKNHKYISRKKGKNGQWVYTYGKNGHEYKKDGMTVEGDNVNLNTADNMIEMIKKYGVKITDSDGKTDSYAYEDLKNLRIRYVSGNYRLSYQTKDGKHKVDYAYANKEGADHTAKVHPTKKVEEKHSKYSHRSYKGIKRKLSSSTLRKAVKDL